MATLVTQEVKDAEQGWVYWESGMKERSGTVGQETENGRRGKVWTAGTGWGAQGQDRQISSSTPLLPGSVQGSQSGVCQGEQVVAWRHSKGNGFLGSC